MNRSMSKIRHMQEANLKLEKRLLKEDDVAATSAANINSATANKEQENLFKFLKGIVDISPYGGMGLGWIPDVTVKNATKLNPKMLGPFYQKYKDIYGRTIKDNQPMAWSLYPLNKSPKAEGVSCHIGNENGKLQIYITTGSRMAAGQYTLSGGYLATPGVLEESLNNLKKIYDIYKVQ